MRFFFLYPRKIPEFPAKKLVWNYSIEDFNSAFFFSGVKVTVSIPSHLHVRVTEPPSDFLNVYALVDEQGSVRVPVWYNYDKRINALYVKVSECLP